MIDRDEQVASSSSPTAAASLEDHGEGRVGAAVAQSPSSLPDDVPVAVPCDDEGGEACSSPFDEGVTPTAQDGDDDEHDDDTTADQCEGEDDGEYRHGFEPGDHVLRWTHVAYMYPIQVHGIVLSAGPGIVTLVDFGRSGSSPRGSTYGPPSSDEGTLEEEAKKATDEAASGGGGKERQQQKTTTQTRRLVVMTLTEESEIRRWKKVEYGENLLSGGRLKRFLVSLISSGSGGGNKKDATAGNGESSDTAAPDEEAKVAEMEMLSEEELLRKIDEGCLQDLSAASRAAASGEKASAGPSSSGDDAGEEEVSKERETKTTATALPRADPAKIVLARVRYLLEHERPPGPGHRHDPKDVGTTTDDKDADADDSSSDDPSSSSSSSSSSVLPPYHIFFSNSECIAVWCKTGTFSTLQASVFLHSTALGNAKSTATLALFVSSQTVPVTVTVPAAGIMGWFGVTTTTTSMVPLVSTQPWLIPALAGYGIAAVGGPYVILAAARERWRVATQKLNDGFWDWADGEVYAEAIEGWNGGDKEGLFGEVSSDGAGVDAAEVAVVR